jgi:transcription factor CON7
MVAPTKIESILKHSSINMTDVLKIEFKEIRKEWKARKKEEETQRKQDEERSRAQATATQVDGQPDQPQAGQGPAYQPGSRPQLPPIGYQSAQAGEVPSPYPGQPAPMVYQQGNGQMGQYGQYPPPHSPYGQQGQVYQQRK